MKKNMTIAMAFASLFATGKAQQATKVNDNPEKVVKEISQIRKKKDEKKSVLEPMDTGNVLPFMPAHTSPIFFPKWSVKCKNRMRNVRKRY